MTFRFISKEKTAELSELQKLRPIRSIHNLNFKRFLFLLSKFVLNTNITLQGTRLDHKLNVSILGFINSIQTKEKSFFIWSKTIRTFIQKDYSIKSRINNKLVPLVVICLKESYLTCLLLKINYNSSFQTVIELDTNELL